MCVVGEEEEEEEGGGWGSVDKAGVKVGLRKGVGGCQTWILWWGCVCGGVTRPYVESIYTPSWTPDTLQPRNSCG